MSPAAPAGEALAAAALASLHPLSAHRLHRLLSVAAPSVVLAALTGTGDVPAAVAAVLDSRHVSDDARAALRRAARAVRLDALAERCARAGVEVHHLGGPGYPASLAADPAPPAVLFVRGVLPPADRRSVAVVGTRNATSAGLELAADLGHDLTARGVHVVSGLARGIDGAAHRGALAAGGAGPVAVVGSGCDVPYPSEHRRLWDAVAAAGAVVAEVPPGTAPAAHRFPARNRIIAALSDVVVVVESRAAGGSLITANEALLRGIPVLAVPGSPRNPAAAGTNRLLVDGSGPVADVGDVLVALGLERPAPRAPRRDRRPTPLPADQVLLDLLGTDPVDLDTLVRRAGTDLQDVAMAVGRLEQAGWVVHTGAWVQRSRS